ncbi:MAG: ATP-binding protein, partial [Oscillospiraceae bacterium]
RARLGEMISRDSMLSRFTGIDEVRGEFRFIHEGKTPWLSFRCVKMKPGIGGNYSEFIVLRKIHADHLTIYTEELRKQLINGLAVPYLILDLINLKNNSYYSSFDNREHSSESYDGKGSFSDAVQSFLEQNQYSEEDRNAVLYNFSVENMAKRFKTGEKVIECEICQHSGEKSEWLRIQAFMTSVDENGDPITAILTVQPITEEKMKALRYQQRLERALRSESQYRQAILSNAIAVYTYNITKDTIYDEIIEEEGVEPLLPKMGLTVPCSYNEYIRRKAQYFPDKTEADAFCRTYCTETLADMFNSHRRSFDTEYEFEMNGRKGYFREAVILTQDLETGDIWGLTYVRNITEEHNRANQVEQALRDAFTQAQHANSAKTLFMSQMSHDIRTPLNSILGMSAIAQEHINEPSRVMDCLNKIESSGRHLLEIVNNVLDLSAIESGKTVLASEPFELRGFLEETLKIIRPLADKKRHTLITTIDPDMNTSVIGDQTKLRQLLTNILGNAVKYTPDCGEISFTAKEIEPDHHGICRYVFTVKDNGIGMKPEFLEHIFDPFVRADDRRISGIQGTGLGMTISINLARMMNGDIGIKSEPGKGSVFEITICLKQGDKTSGYISGISLEEPRKVRMSDFDFGGARVLLAEDLEFNAEIASEFLAEANIITDIAHDGAEAAEMFNSSKEGYYSLIFMDIQMPVLDGNQAAEKIRSLDRPDAKTVPIIAMTANAFIEDVKKSKAHGMNGHVTKPLDIKSLTTELCKWLPEYKKNKN